MSPIARRLISVALLGLLPLTAIDGDELPAGNIAASTFSSTSSIQGTTLKQHVADSRPQRDDPLDRPLSLTPATSTDRTDRPLPHVHSTRAGLSTLVGGLAVCLGVFLLFVWATRRNQPKGVGPLPTEVVELLGRMPLDGRQHLQLIRVGKKLVLVCVSPQGTEALTEIDEVDEVTRLCGLCHEDKPNSVTATFREVLGEYGREPSIPGFLGDIYPTDHELANRPRRRSALREVVHD